MPQKIQRHTVSHTNITVTLTCIVDAEDQAAGERWLKGCQARELARQEREHAGIAAKAHARAAAALTKAQAQGESDAHAQAQAERERVQPSQQLRSKRTPQVQRERVQRATAAAAREQAERERVRCIAVAAAHEQAERERVEHATAAKHEKKPQILVDVERIARRLNISGDHSSSWAKNTNTLLSLSGMNISRWSTKKDVMKAYHALAKIVHPDRVSVKFKDEATKVFQIVQEAYFGALKRAPDAPGQRPRAFDDDDDFE